MAAELAKGERVEVPASLENEFSRENLIYYAAVCRQVAWKIVEFAADNQGRPVAILLPSRGAIPFFVGADIVLRTDPHLSEFDFDGKIEIPLLSCFERVRKENGHPGRKIEVKTLVAPFTADVRLDERLKGDKPKADLIVGDMRRFMARVVAEFFEDPRNRNGKEFVLFNRFLEEIEGRGDLTRFYREFGQIEKVLMIDTVISGRASYTILREFEEIGIKPGAEVEPFLIVDRGGANLNKNYRGFVDRSRSVFMPRILSEDRGAALLGIVAVAYPDLILGAKNQGFESDLFPYFASWHDVPKKHRAQYMKVFNLFIGVVEAILTDDEKAYSLRRDEFLQSLVRGRFLSRGDVAKDDVKEFLRNGIKPARVEETSSHVIQVGLSPDTVNSLLRKIYKQNS